MSDGLYPESLRDEDEALVRIRPANRTAFFLQVRAVQRTARDVRAESREIVARCVEDRITREDRRVSKDGGRRSRRRPAT